MFLLIADISQDRGIDLSAAVNALLNRLFLLNLLRYLDILDLNIVVLVIGLYVIKLLPFRLNIHV